MMCLKQTPANMCVQQSVYHNWHNIKTPNFVQVIVVDLHDPKLSSDSFRRQHCKLLHNNVLSTTEMVYECALHMTVTMLL